MEYPIASSRITFTTLCLMLLMTLLHPFICTGQNTSVWKQRADSITAGCKTSYQKAKAIYTWEVLNLEYDYSYKITSAKNCWRLRKGVCQAFSELFVLLAQNCGLEAWVISGQARNHEYPNGDGPHAWVAAKTEKGIILIDPTWGVDPWDEKNPQHVLRWFDVKPECMIFAHFPNNPQAQYLSKPITEEQYRSLPDIEPMLMKVLTNPASALSYFLKHPNERTPTIWNGGNGLINTQILQMPFGRKLIVGKTYTFKIKCLKPNMKITSSQGKWVKDGNTYTMVFRPTKEGRLSIESPEDSMFEYEIVVEK